MGFHCSQKTLERHEFKTNYSKGLGVFRRRFTLNQAVAKYIIDK